jgi:hypothetical protein
MQPSDSGVIFRAGLEADVDLFLIASEETYALEGIEWNPKEEKDCRSTYTSRVRESSVLVAVDRFMLAWTSLAAHFPCVQHKHVPRGPGYLGDRVVSTVRAAGA